MKAKIFMLYVGDKYILSSDSEESVEEFVDTYITIVTDFFDDMFDDPQEMQDIADKLNRGEYEVEEDIADDADYYIITV